MCIVADSVNDVSKTQIASFHVGYSLEKGDIIQGQLVIYSANIDSTANSNALILPVYNPNNDPDKIIPLDFSNMTNFFIDLSYVYDKWFPKKEYKSMSLSNSNSYSLHDESLLAVHKVGDYQFSIVPNKRDFHRINTSKLFVSPVSQKVIDMHSDDYSFIVYQFYNRGKLEIPPFAYLCQPYNDRSFVIPTIHGHPDNNPVGYGSFAPIGGSNSFEESAHYDHIIYTLIKSKPNSHVNESDVKKIHSILKNITIDYQKRSIRVFCPKNFVPDKFEIKNYAKNRNMFIRENGYVFANDLIIDVR